MVCSRLPTPEKLQHLERKRERESVGSIIVCGAMGSDGSEKSNQAGYQKRIEELEERVQADERERQELALNVQGVPTLSRHAARGLESFQASCWVTALTILIILLF